MERLSAQNKTRTDSSSWRHARSRFYSKNNRGYAKELKVTVSPDWLEHHRSSKNLSILDARSRGAYRRSHIPGAIHADLFHYFVPGTDRKGLQKFQNDLARKLGNMGLTGKESSRGRKAETATNAGDESLVLDGLSGRTFSTMERDSRRGPKSQMLSERRD